MNTDNVNIADLSPEELIAIKEFEKEFISKFDNHVYVIAYQSQK